MRAGLVRSEAMSPQAVARLMAVGRVAIGGVLMAAPQITKPFWVRNRDYNGGVALFGRMVGARDLGIGAGLLAALGSGAPTGGWLAVGMLADAADIAAAAIERDRLPPTALPIFIAVAGSGVLMGAYALAAGEDSAAGGASAPA
jgi:hypothetical protein